MSAEACSREGCEGEVVTAIRTWLPASGDKGIHSTLYQFPEDAPKNALRYCILHAALCLVALTGLSDADAKRLTVTELMS